MGNTTKIINLFALKIIKNTDIILDKLNIKRYYMK